MNLAHELAKIEAGKDKPLPSRLLSQAEIDALVAAGSITPLDQVPAERCRRRESMPRFYGATTFGRIIWRRPC